MLTPLLYWSQAGGCGGEEGSATFPGKASEASLRISTGPRGGREERKKSRTCTC